MRVADLTDGSVGWLVGWLVVDSTLVGTACAVETEDGGVG